MSVSVSVSALRPELRADWLEALARWLWSGLDARAPSAFVRAETDQVAPAATIEAALRPAQAAEDGSDAPAGPAIGDARSFVLAARLASVAALNQPDGRRSRLARPKPAHKPQPIRSPIAPKRIVKRFVRLEARSAPNAAAARPSADIVVLPIASSTARPAGTRKAA